MAKRVAFSIAAVVLSACTIAPHSAKVPNRIEAVPMEGSTFSQETARAIRERDRGVTPLAIPLSSADGAVPASFTFRGPDNIAGVTYALWIDSPSNWRMIAGAFEGLWETVDGGFHWRLIPQFVDYQINTIVQSPSSSDVLFAGTGEGFHTVAYGILRSTDRGVTWTGVPGSASLHNVYTIAILSTDSRVMLAATENGIFRSADSGDHWTVVLPGTWANAPTATFDPRGDGHAVATLQGSDGVRVYYSTDAGENWLPSLGPAPAMMGMRATFALSAPGMVYLLRLPTYGVDEIWKSLDSGKTFNRVSSSTIAGGGTCTHLWVSPDDSQFLLVGGTMLSRSTDGGLSFIEINDFASGATYGGNPPHMDIHGMVNDPLWAGTKFRRLFVLSDGGIWRSNDIRSARDTFGWDNLNRTYLTNTAYSVDASAYDDIIYGSQDTGHGYIPAGSTTETVGNDGDISHVEFDPYDRHTFFLGVFNTVARENDDGRLETPIYNEGSIADTAVFTVTPFDVGGTSLWVGSNSLLRFDNARTGTPTRLDMHAPGTGLISAVSVSMNTPNVVWFAREGGALYKTSNALLSTPRWDPIPTSIPYVRKIVFDALDDFTVFVMTAGGEVWVTYDGGTTFHSITPPIDMLRGRGMMNSFAVHPHNDHWLYLGMSGGMLVSKDGGVTWNNMPDFMGIADIRDLRFRLGTTRLYVATYGRGVWSADIPGTPLRRRHGVTP